MESHASQLAQRLAAHAESVCKFYLPSGRRAGRYWIVGDVAGSPGKSLYVHLFGDRAGKWTDSATSEHGDLLDLIGLNQGHGRLADTLAEARRFLNEPFPDPRTSRASSPPAPRPTTPRAAGRDSMAAAEKLFRLSKPIPGTLAETYLRSRGITASLASPSLRFHPACFYRPDEHSPRETWPALIAAVTDPGGAFTGIQRTYLARDGRSKAPMSEPRRAMGNLLGSGVRFGGDCDVLAAGEGIETVLSLLSVFPALPTIAGLSSAHLSAIHFPSRLRRLYILRDNDAAGGHAVEALTRRCAEHGIEAHVLTPRGKDLNVDLRQEGPSATRANIALQLTPDNARRFGS
jgi:hypothetical protein